ncbi:MAG: hypothetical protein Q9N34_03320 [Aquificota bacterium]|nr:hypothetical protein [Aquificota bacterium]
MGGLENKGLLRGVPVPMIGVLLGAALSVFACGADAGCEEYKALLPSKEQIEKVRRDFEKFKNRRIQIDMRRICSLRRIRSGK